MRFVTLLTCLVLLMKMQGFAQDPHFSQFFASPLTLNPALTGKFDGVFRVAGNYRDQWPSISQAFVTSTISVDAPMLTSKLNSNDVWGIGVMGMSDKTANGILTSNYLSISTAYHKGLDEDGLQQLGFGFQGTYASKRLDGTQLHLEDGLKLDGTWQVSPSEPILNTQVANVNFFDFNAGILYNGSTNGYNNFYLGASMYHINKPRENFIQSRGFYQLNPRLTIHSGGYFKVGETTTLHLTALYSQQAGATETVFGGAVAFNLDNSQDENATNFYAGSWVRFNDAIIPYVGLEWSDFRLGATYDVNYSNLKVGSQSRGGVEISLIYIKRLPSGRKGIPCPKL